VIIGLRQEIAEGPVPYCDSRALGCGSVMVGNGFITGAENALQVSSCWVFEYF
jgi:hypothetical protein